MRFNLFDEDDGKGFDFFRRYLNEFVSVNINTEGKSRVFYTSINFGTIFNKAFELEVELNKRPYRHFHIGFSLSLKGDHCGPTFGFGLMGLEIDLKMYDCRHWNWEANRFYTPGEEMCEHEARKQRQAPIKAQVDEINKKIEELQEQREQVLATVNIKECF